MNLKFPEERGDPDEFKGRIGNSFILGLYTGSGHGRLFLGAPRDKVVTKIDQESTCRTSVKRVTSPIGITERSKKDRGCTIIV